MPANVHDGERVVADGEVTAVFADAVECAVWLDVERDDERVWVLQGVASVRRGC